MRPLGLDDPGCVDVAVAGGKGAGLARLRRAGLEVPDGVVLPPGCADVDAAYLALADRSGQTDPVVGVRSSAVWEDGASASAAGQLETVLGVRGVAAVREAVRRCVASGSGEAVRAYRSRSQSDGDQDAWRREPSGNPDGTGGGVAVVVQLLVPAAVSGVAFTAHPVSGERDLVVVEAAPGLGEAVVSGLVTPEHLEVSRSTGRVVRRMPGWFPLRRDYDEAADGVVDRAVADAASPVLDDAALAAVVDVALRAEAVLGTPADVEWALPAGWRPGEPVVVLQARPVTALPGSPPPGG